MAPGILWGCIGPTPAPSSPPLVATSSRIALCSNDLCPYSSHVTLRHSSGLCPSPRLARRLICLQGGGGSALVCPSGLASTSAALLPTHTRARPRLGLHSSHLVSRASFLLQPLPVPPPHLVPDCAPLRVLLLQCCTVLCGRSRLRTLTPFFRTLWHPWGLSSRAHCCYLLPTASPFVLHVPATSRRVPCRPRSWCGPTSYFVTSPARTTASTSTTARSLRTLSKSLGLGQWRDPPLIGIAAEPYKPSPMSLPCACLLSATSIALSRRCAIYLSPDAHPDGGLWLPQVWAYRCSLGRVSHPTQGIQRPPWLDP